MNEVSCRAFSYFVTAEQAGWITLDALLEGSRLTRTRLDDPSQRVDWDDWSLLCDRFADLVGYHRLRESAQFALQPGFAGPILHAVAPLLTSPLNVYRAGYQYGAALTYRCVSLQVAEEPTGQIRMTAELHPGYRPSRAWFEMLVGGADALLEYVGMPVVVQASLTSTSADILATPRPRRSLWAWLGRVFAAFAAPGRLTEEFVFQAQQLQDTYQELARRERSVYTMLAHLPAAVVLLREGRVAYANNRFAEVVGKPISALLGQDVLALVVEEDREIFRRAFFERGLVTPVVIRVCRGGEIRSLRASPLEEIVFEGIVSQGLFALDVTDEVRARASLERQEETVQAMSLATTDVILRVSAGGEVQDIFGGGDAVEVGALRALRGRSIAGGGGLLPGCAEDDVPRLTAAVAGVLSTGRFDTLELANDAGGRVYEYVFAPIAGRNEVLIVGRDITSRRQHERALAISERMASLGTLSAGIGHEINNPLTYILANQTQILEIVDTMAAEGRDDVKELRTLAIETRQGAERVRDIVKDLRTFSRVDPMQAGGAPLDAVVEEALRLVGNQLRHRARIVTELGDVGFVCGDRARLVQVFVNLLVNAAQALPEHDERSLITVRTAREGEHVFGWVIDNGTGISPQHLRRVFDPFFTTKPAGEGSGLGLAIVHRIVEECGGSVRLTSEPGHGTEVRLELRPATPVVAPPPIVHATQRPARRRRILVVDDEPLVAKAVAHALRAHDVETTNSGTEAIARIVQGGFGAVVCDLNMPGCDGIDVFYAAKAHDPDLIRRFLVMTGGAFTERSQAFLDQVRPAILEKPVWPAELARRVDEMWGVEDVAV